MTELSPIGWREYIALPELNIPEIKAKIDTGARSSALHAFAIAEFERDGQTMVRFSVHPYQRDSDRVIVAEAILLDRRSVRSSSGASQLRPVIQTVVELGGQRWAIELTLTNRDEMGFRMLLGREAIRQRFLVDAGNSYIQNPQQQNQTDFNEE
ncbi:ATP-dependent zinc protease [Spirulina sp. 06S082]|uniref:ATP-dependent zinc protease family protein n=1 Tax=Spirulina sp. 06S082 TaxID=3110248 RepID=UPI002B20DEF3|nr:ATP-dependent zinc protease [Spirulina sp. 06S082]MEA5470663.1 ATP-dependent zinc protease [Spirulina sp. 06S082]